MLGDAADEVRGMGGAPTYVVEHISRVFGYRFREPHLLLQALISPSDTSHKSVCNAQLEFIGDAAMDFAICRAMVHSALPLLAKDMSFIKQTASNSRLLSMLGVHCGLHKLVVVGREMCALKPELQALVPQDINRFLYFFINNSKRNAGSVASASLLSHLLFGDGNMEVPQLAPDAGVCDDSSGLTSSPVELLVGACLKAVFVDSGFDIDAVTVVVRQLRLVPCAL